MGLLMSFLLVSCGRNNAAPINETPETSAKIQEVLPKKLSFEELKTKIVNNLFDRITTESDKIIWEKGNMNLSLVSDWVLSWSLSIESEWELKGEDTAWAIKLNADATVMWQPVGWSVDFNFISLSQSGVAYFKLNNLDISKIESSIWAQSEEIITIAEKLKSKWVKISTSELWGTNTLKSLLILNKVKTLTNENFPLTLSGTEWEDNWYYTYPIVLDKEATAKLIIGMAELSPDTKITESEKTDLINQIAKISLKWVIWVSKKSYDDFSIKLELSSVDMPETIYIELASSNNKFDFSISDNNTGSGSTTPLSKFSFKFNLVWEDMSSITTVNWVTVLTATGKLSYLAWVSNYDISMLINENKVTGMPALKARLYGNSVVKAKTKIDYVIPVDAEEIEKVLASTSETINSTTSYSEDKILWLKGRFMKPWQTENVSFDSNGITLKNNKWTYDTLNSFELNWEKVVAVKGIKESIDPIILNQFILDNESFNLMYVSPIDSNNNKIMAYFKAKWVNCIKSDNLSVINYGKDDCLLKSSAFNIENIK